MNNWIIKYIKFFTVFVTATSAMLALYYLFTTSETEKKLNFFKPENIRNICSDAIKTNKYQLCFRKEIPNLFEIASPFDLIYISNLMDSLKERELFQCKTKKERIETLRSYYTNRSIYNDYISRYRLNRNSIDFFQIVLLPYVKRKYKMRNMDILNDYKKLIEQYPEVEKDNEIKRAITNIISTVKVSNNEFRK